MPHSVVKSRAWTRASIERTERTVGRLLARKGVKMYEAARQTGVPTELIIFGDEGHGAGRRDNQVLMIGHALRWMNQHLKGR